MSLGCIFDFHDCSDKTKTHQIHRPCLVWPWRFRTLEEKRGAVTAVGLKRVMTSMGFKRYWQILPGIFWDVRDVHKKGTKIDKFCSLWESLLTIFFQKNGWCIIHRHLSGIPWRLCFQQTMVFSLQATGEQLKEAIEINRSLTALGDVIEAWEAGPHWEVPTVGILGQIIEDVIFGTDLFLNGVFVWMTWISLSLSIYNTFKDDYTCIYIYI